MEKNAKPIWRATYVTKDRLVCLTEYGHTLREAAESLFAKAKAQGARPKQVWCVFGYLTPVECESVDGSTYVSRMFSYVIYRYPSARVSRAELDSAESRTNPIYDAPAEKMALTYRP